MRQRSPARTPTVGWLPARPVRRLPSVQARSDPAPNRPPWARTARVASSLSPSRAGRTSVSRQTRSGPMDQHDHRRVARRLQPLQPPGPSFSGLVRTGRPTTSRPGTPGERRARTAARQRADPEQRLAQDSGLTRTAPLAQDSAPWLQPGRSRETAGLRLTSRSSLDRQAASTAAGSTGRLRWTGGLSSTAAGVTRTPSSSRARAPPTARPRPAPGRFSHAPPSGTPAWARVPGPPAETLLQRAPRLVGPPSRHPLGFAPWAQGVPCPRTSRPQRGAPAFRRPESRDGPQPRTSGAQGGTSGKAQRAAAAGMTGLRRRRRPPGRCTRRRRPPAPGSRWQGERSWPRS